MKLLKKPKVDNRRMARAAAHVQTTREDKVRTRWRTGGFKSPGSNKKTYPRGVGRKH